MGKYNRKNIMKDYLSNQSFVDYSDIIFAKNVYPEKNEFKNNIEIFLNEKFNEQLKENDLIFCKHEFIQSLFSILDKRNDLKNLKLITRDSDCPVNQTLFNNKPKCVSKWYAQNVEYDHDDLIPIPIGLAPEYYDSSYLTINSINNTSTEKEKLLYINHRIQTYPHDRKWIYEYFTNNEWCTVDNPNLDLEKYKHRLNTHHFILCPRGNGIDTHRLWESMYLGIFPIVENNIHYEKCLIDLPVILVDSFKEVTYQFLLEKIEDFKNKKFNMKKLNTSWWIKNIKEGNL